MNPGAHMNVGRVGIWTPQLDLVPQAQAQEHVVELEELGYGAVWIPEAVGREALSAAALLLSGSSRIVVATGIANIWARDPMAMAGGHKTLTEAFPGRFLLGLGVSHQVAVDHLRGHTYERPLTHMREYLDAMDAALFMAAEPATAPQRVLAALGPKMLELSATRAAGALPYFVPVEHTTVARAALGDGPLLCVEQAVVLESDPDVARGIARGHMAIYLGLPNYTNNLKRLGWTDADIAEGGSDALVDAIVAWGGLDAAVERVQAHHDRGADHVCVQVLPAPMTAVPVQAWRELAPALLA
ncbi:MAG TPA: LLM class F420-dependent oxidoreductase [Acidimicrobiales bacterium]